MPPCASGPSRWYFPNFLGNLSLVGSGLDMRSHTPHPLEGYHAPTMDEALKNPNRDA
jgi:hypothetical protein